MTSVDYLPRVTSVGEQAVSGCSSVTSVNLPGAETIELSAFASCSKLTGVTAPNVTKVEDGTYDGCTLLNSVDYLPRVTSVGEQAFYGCAALTSLDLPKVTSIGNYAFQDCTLLATLKLGYAGTISLPSTLVLFGNTSAASRANTIDLFLNPAVDPQPVDKTWNGYTWKSIDNTYTP